MSSASDISDLKGSHSEGYNALGAAFDTSDELQREATSTTSGVTEEVALKETSVERRASSSEKTETGETSTLTGPCAPEPSSEEKDQNDPSGENTSMKNDYLSPSRATGESESPPSDSLEQVHSSTSTKKGGDLQSSADSRDAHESVEMITPTQKGGWSLTDSLLAVDATSDLRNTAIRPSFVTISGTRWEEDDLLDCLSELSKVECPVYLTPLDTFWVPSKEGRKKTRARIDALLAEGHKCKLLFVWGALDLPTLKSLPQSVNNVGIALSAKKDMELVHVLDKRRNQFEFIHFSFSKTFKPKYWRKRALPPKSDEDVSICLHFPELTKQDLTWMKEIISAVVPRSEGRSCVWGVYLPSTSLSAVAVLGQMLDAGLQCRVFLPATNKPAEGEKKDVLKTYRWLNCSVAWILEDL